jgi:hypothetical protein
VAEVTGARGGEVAGARRDGEPLKPQLSLRDERKWGRERCTEAMSLEGIESTAAARAGKKLGFGCGCGGTWDCAELMGF